MSVKIIIDEKNEFEAEFPGVDKSLVQLLAERLTADKNVEFAAYKLEHPVVANPKLYVRTKKGDAKTLVIEKIAEVKGELEEFKKKFSGIVK